MTRAEWAGVLQKMEACWPARPIRDDSAALWFADLNDFPAIAVSGAVLALYRSGREFMPNGAQIRDEIATQTVDALPFREAWNLLLDGIRRHGSTNAGRVIEYVSARSHVAGQWAARTDIREIGMSREGDTTVYAQARQHYDNVTARTKRAITNGGLPSAAVPALRTSTGPRPAGRAVADLVAGLNPEAKDDAA